MLASKGIIHVNSAGNDGMGTWKKINFPSDAEDMLSVGAVTPQGVNASFSSLGPTADGRVKPDVVALGSPTAVVSSRGTLTSEQGTSFSTPVISGMVACLWQALPDKTAKEIIELVRQSGNNYEHPDNVYGYGLPDFTKALKQGKHETDPIAP
jgi:subtilisin family serine protease